MAIDDGLKYAVRRVTDNLGSFARSRGWDRHDYRIAYRAQRRSGQLYFIFASKHFNADEELQDYMAVRSYLKERLADEPDLLDSLGIVIETYEQVEEGGLYAIGPEYRSVVPRDLASTALRDVAQLVGRYAETPTGMIRDYRLFYRFGQHQTICQIRIDVDPSTASIGEIREDLSDWLRENLSDDPDVLRSYELEIVVNHKSTPIRDTPPEDAGFKNYHGVRNVG